jgi:nucleoside-diphosphate-sugar epimerase
MAKVFVTGGAGFMGRWVSKNLVEEGHKVWVLDDLSNCSEKNIEEFRDKLEGFNIGDIKDKELLAELFKNEFDVCIHMAAAINVQDSIDNPDKCFNDNVTGTFNVLEECRKHGTKMVFISSALVYQTAGEGESISEDHPVNPSCPYAASKIFGEDMTLSYYRTYGLPVVVLRPFSIYGPWQRSDSEGGVMSIFLNRKLKGEALQVYGDGKQGRDFFYVEDCAEFIRRAAFSDAAVGQVFNAGSGLELKIKDLAERVASGEIDVEFIDHHHPHAEVMSMQADSEKARNLLGWEPMTNLEEGMSRLESWLSERNTLTDVVK